MAMFYILFGVITLKYTVVKIHQFKHLRSVHVIVYKLYLFKKTELSLNLFIYLFIYLIFGLH